MKTIAQRLAEYYASKSILNNMPESPCEICGKPVIQPYSTHLECDEQVEQEMKEQKEREEMSDAELEDMRKWQDAERWNDDPDNWEYYKS